MGKGQEWERETAKLLSLWWSNGESDDLIWRTAGSGARATTRRKVGKGTVNACGDLCYTDQGIKPLFDFMIIECKRGYSTKKVKGKKVPASPSEAINVLYWLDRPTNTKPPLLHRWWIKLGKERRAAGAYHQCIIFKRTGKRKVIMVDYDLYNQLHVYQSPQPYEPAIISVSLSAKETYMFLDLEHFLKWLAPGTIMLLLGEYTTGGAQQKRSL